MKFNGQLLDGLVIFVEVVDNGSFTKAAQISGHSTSYISKEISKLEARLGIRLLNRTTRSIHLTPEGQMYYQQCSQLIHDAQQAEDVVLGRQINAKGILKVSVPVGFALSKLRPILAEFLSLYPDIELDLELNDRKVDLINDGFDLAIRAARYLEDSSLICKRFMTCPMVVLAAPSYLVKHGYPETIQDLSEHHTISYRYIKNPMQWVFKKSKRPEQTVTVKSQVLTNSAEMELALCEAGVGITRLPSFYLDDQIKTGKVVALFEDYDDTNVGVYLVYPSRKYMSAKVRCFIDYIDQKLGDKVYA